MQKALNAGKRLNPLKKINGKNIFFPAIQVGFNLSQSVLKAFRFEYSIVWNDRKILLFIERGGGRGMLEGGGVCMGFDKRRLLRYSVRV